MKIKKPKFGGLEMLIIGFFAYVVFILQLLWR